MTYFQKLQNFFQTETKNRGLRACWRFLVRNAENAALLGFCAALLIGAAASTGAETEQYAQDVLRLHVVANSDSVQDQTVKLMVRDAVVQETQRVLAETSTKEQAVDQMTSHLHQLTQAANKTLQAAGFPYRAAVRLCRSVFPNRQYGDTLLPAGEYDAIRVELGAAEGKNWWCILFPQLCLPAASETAEPNAPCQWRFAFWEWLQRLCGGLYT